MLAFAAAWPAPSRGDESLLERLHGAAEKDLHAEVVQLAGALLEQDDAPAETYYLRGRARFCLGDAAGAVEDFDRFVALRPQLAPQQWERGIACYYAGQFEEGAKQFALYQTYHDNDVENSVWRFLCLVPQVGAEEARRTMLPIRNDPRIPMMKIYDVYRGRATPLEVSLAAYADQPPEAARDARTFYARLYMGLWYLVVEQDEASARLLLSQAAEQHRETRGINRFMWSVAKVHADRLAKSSAPSE